MESGQIKLLHKTLDDIRHQNGIEFWYARELYPILGYSQWENLETAINRAKESSTKTNQKTDDHFQDVTKMVSMS